MVPAKEILMVYVIAKFWCGSNQLDGIASKTELFFDLSHQMSTHFFIGLRFVFRRHFAFLNLIQNVHPKTTAFSGTKIDREIMQRKIGLLNFLAMTGCAVVTEKFIGAKPKPGGLLILRKASLRNGKAELD